MKPYIIILILSFLSLINTAAIHGQNCKKFHLYGECMQYAGPYYKMDSQSRSNIIGYGDKLIYSVIFYGGRQYNIIFCATDLFKPVRFILIDGETREVIYDNSKDEYTESIEMSIEYTRRIMVEVTVVAKEAEKNIIENYFGCVGFLIDWKPEKKKK